MQHFSEAVDCTDLATSSLFDFCCTKGKEFEALREPLESLLKTRSNGQPKVRSDDGPDSSGRRC